MPKGYLEWSIRETENNANASEDLKHLANYARSKLFPTEDQEKQDPEENAVIPYYEEEEQSSTSSRTTWSMVKELSKKGQPSTSQKPIIPKAKAKSTAKGTTRKVPESEDQTRAMETEIPPEALDEIHQLMTRLAVLKDQYNLGADHS